MLPNPANGAKMIPNEGSGPKVTFGGVTFSEDVTPDLEAPTIVKKNWTSVYESGVASYEKFGTDKVEESDIKRYGTLFGVFLPCLQNILGVILFLRLPWIVGQAGVLATSAIILICVLSTSLTTLSMSALATNGRIPAGGPYAIVTQNLGAEVGGAVGLLFYLGTTLAATLYILGGVEALFTIFIVSDGDCATLNATDCTEAVTGLFFFDKQVIGVLTMLVLGAFVIIGMEFVSKIALVFLAAVLCAIFFMTLGIILFAAGVYIPTDPGIVRGSLSENLMPDYEPDLETGVLFDFTALIALFFPSVTGIMAGSNRSGVLQDPGRSIPRGTLSAVVLTTCFYLITVWMFGAVIANETLKSNKLIAASIAWPHMLIVAIGILMSCVGAALQCLTGAPQLLKSLANDGHVPFLHMFGTVKPDGEPKKAVVTTTVIAALCCLAGNLDYITPIITMFFLSMYAAINLSCFFCSYVKSPGFRPKWRYYHWSTALTGFFSCIITMLVISTLYAVVALAFVVLLCSYIFYNRERREWGNAVVGLRLEQATSNLVALSDISYRKRKVGLPTYFSTRRKSSKTLKRRLSRSGSFVNTAEKHLKGVNWRPQIRVFCKMDDSLQKVTNPELLRLAQQLKKGRGLTIALSVIEGDVTEGNYERLQKAELSLKEELYHNRIKGFAEVVASDQSLLQTFKVLLQSSGLGPLTTNTVLLSWPTKRQDVEADAQHRNMYVDILKSCLGAGKAIVVQKFLTEFPKRGMRITGTIDVWWLIHDGGILVLLPYLLQRHRVWRECKLRIFAITPENLVDTTSTEERLKGFLEQLRIEAIVRVIPIGVSDARDIDENRTVIVKNGIKTPSGHASVLSADLFQPPAPEEEEVVESPRVEEARPELRSPRAGKNILSKMKRSFSAVFDENTEPSTPPLTEEELRKRLAPTAKALMEQGVSESTRLWVDDFSRRRAISSVTFENAEMEAAALKSIAELDEAESGSPAVEATTPPKEEKIKEDDATLSSEDEEETLRQLEQRLETAQRLNKLFKRYSSEAAVLVLNLPLSRKTPNEEFLKYTEALTDDLPKVLMIRGNGNERINNYV